MSLNRLSFLASVVLLACAALVWGNASGPPANRSGLNGITCSTSGCHDDVPANTGPGSVLIGGLPLEWSPNTTYPLTVTVDQSGQSLFGFQLTAVDSGGGQAGAFTAASGMKVDNDLVGGNAIEHIEHSFPKPGGGTATFSFDWTAPTSVATGNVRFNVAGNAANGNFSSSGDFVYSDEIVVSGVEEMSGGDDTTVYLAEIGDGLLAPNRYLTTTIYVLNPDSSNSTTITISFTGQDGGGLNLPFLDSNNNPANVGNTISTTLAGGESRRYVSSAAGGLVQGLAAVTSASPVEALAVLSYFDGAPGTGTVISEAALGARQPSTRQAILVDESVPFTTFFAYGNPSKTVDANVTLELLTTQGVVVATTAVSLAVGAPHASQFLPTLFSSVAGHVGTLRMTSDVPIVAAALRFNGERFTSLPPFEVVSLDMPHDLRLQRAMNPFSLALFGRESRNVIESVSLMP